MYCTYLLGSLKDNRGYKGFPRDLKQRFEEHQKDFSGIGSNLI
jgi:predicted GIY-YIG superfamily endonuclease